MFFREAERKYGNREREREGREGRAGGLDVMKEMKFRFFLSTSVDIICIVYILSFLVAVP